MIEENEKIDSMGRVKTSIPENFEDVFGADDISAPETPEPSRKPLKPAKFLAIKETRKDTLETSYLFNFDKNARNRINGLRLDHPNKEYEIIQVTVTEDKVL